MIQNEYLIQELADKTGVNPRTIRYYQEKGLLPWPENRGKYAYYNDDHIERLRLIQELKRNYLPLDEIAKQLNALNSQQVKNLLENYKVQKFNQASPRDISTSQPIEPSAKAALEYISGVRRSQPEAGVMDFDKDQPALFQTQKNERYAAGTPTESWRRILLANWLDIQVKEPLSPENEKLLEELIKFAKNLIR